VNPGARFDQEFGKANLNIACFESVAWLSFLANENHLPIASWQKYFKLKS